MGEREPRIYRAEDGTWWQEVPGVEGHTVWAESIPVYDPDYFESREAVEAAHGPLTEMRLVAAGPEVVYVTVDKWGFVEDGPFFSPEPHSSVETMLEEGGYILRVEYLKDQSEVSDG